MKKEEFYILNNLYDASLGRAQNRTDLFLSHALRSAESFAELTEKGLIDKQAGTLTPKGLEALEPYRVDNAVILAAGSATRFIPRTRLYTTYTWPPRPSSLFTASAISSSSCSIT